jgi:hypothetical protein
MNLFAPSALSQSQPAVFARSGEPFSGLIHTPHRFYCASPELGPSGTYPVYCASVDGY